MATKRKTRGVKSLKGLQGKIKKGLKTKEGKAVAVIVGGLALWTLFGSGTGGSGNPDVILSGKLSPVDVGDGEMVSTQFYRVLGQRREGFVYQPLVQGSLGQKIEFAGPQGGGVFTRNVVQDDNGVGVEFKA